MNISGSLLAATTAIVNNLGGDPIAFADFYALGERDDVDEHIAVAVILG